VAQQTGASALAEALREQERTESWLARKTGKSPSYVHRVITGERNPSDDFKARASAALAVPLCVLFP
jgi:transcriptional regulator with XRE-family HTH domain